VTRGLKVFFYYTILLAIFVSISLLSIQFINSQKLYLINIRFYVVFEYVLFALFFYNLFRNEFVKKIVLFSSIPFILYSGYDFLISAPNTFSNLPLIIEFLAFIIFIIYFFYEKMQTVVSYPLYQSITFWICVALFIYFSGNFFFLIFLKSSKDPAFIYQMKIIYSFITITKNIILCLALLGYERIESTDENLNIPSDVNLDEFSLNNYKNN
jgi:hypothetical protein